MKRVLFTIAIYCLAPICVATTRGEEANASVYVVDHSAEFQNMGGACIDYTPGEKTGHNREILALAKGPTGSTVIMLALQGNSLHLGLEPVMAKMEEDSKPLRFPDQSSEGKWPFSGESEKADLYVLAFSDSDPQLEKFVKYLDWLKEAMSEENEESTLLYTHAIKSRISEIVRQQSTDAYLATFGDSLLANTNTFVPEGKAAVTRSGKINLLENTDNQPDAPVAAIRRGLHTIDEEWKEDSRTISFGLASPGLLLFPITTPPSP